MTRDCWTRVIQNVRQRCHATWLRQRIQETECIRNFAAALPFRVDRDDNFRWWPRRVADHHADLGVVGHEAHAFARGEEHAVGDLDPAEAVRSAASGGGIEVFIEAGRPHAQPRIGLVDQEPPAVFVAFAGPHLTAVLDSRIAQPFHQRLDYLPPDAQRAVAGANSRSRRR